MPDIREEWLRSSLEYINSPVGKKFDMTGEGYSEAKDYLSKIGKLDEFMNNKLSVDGYSLVYFPNICKEAEDA